MVNGERVQVYTPTVEYENAGSISQKLLTTGELVVPDEKSATTVYLFLSYPFKDGQGNSCILGSEFRLEHRGDSQEEGPQLQITAVSTPEVNFSIAGTTYLRHVAFQSHLEKLLTRIFDSNGIVVVTNDKNKQFLDDYFAMREFQETIPTSQ